MAEHSNVISFLAVPAIESRYGSLAEQDDTMLRPQGKQWYSLAAVLLSCSPLASLYRLQY